jgi:hypothetical protein
MSAHPDILDLDCWTPYEACKGHGLVGGCADGACGCGAANEEQEFKWCRAERCERCRGTGRIAIGSFETRPAGAPQDEGRR